MSSGRFEEDHIPEPGLVLPEIYNIGFPPIEADETEALNYHETANLFRIEVAQLLNRCNSLEGNRGKAAFRAELSDGQGATLMVDRKLRAVVMAVDGGKDGDKEKPQIQIITNEYLPPVSRDLFPVNIGVTVLNPDGGFSCNSTGAFHDRKGNFIYDPKQPHGPLLTFSDNGDITITSSSPAPYYAPGFSTWSSYEEMIEVLETQRRLIAQLRPDMLVSARTWRLPK